MINMVIKFTLISHVLCFVAVQQTGGSGITQTPSQNESHFVTASTTSPSVLNNNSEAANDRTTLSITATPLADQNDTKVVSTPVSDTPDREAESPKSTNVTHAISVTPKHETMVTSAIVVTNAHKTTVSTSTKLTLKPSEQVPTEDLDHLTERPTIVPSTAETTDSDIADTGTASSVTSPTTRQTFDRSWIDRFQRIHHFDGLYEFNEGQFSFDFVILYIHPVDVHTLVAKFYDQDGAILEMNGTSSDGYHIVFKQSNTFSSDFRFSALSRLMLDGKLVTSGGRTMYSGNISTPLNSSFTWFHMNKGLGSIITGDAASTRTAIIIVIPASLAFLAIIGTTATLCWASKRGLFGRRHKSYLLFKDNPVTYDSEAETIHI